MAEALTMPGLNRMRQRQFDEANAILRQATPISAKHQPEAWKQSYIESLLGLCLLEQKLFFTAEAEWRLSQGAKGLEPRLAGAKATQVFAEAARALIELYRVKRKSDQAEESQKRLCMIESRD